MKRSIILSLFLLILGLQLQSQETAKVQFSLNLSHFQSISLNENQSKVAINLLNRMDFLEGKTALRSNHIAVMSSSDYQVKVSASSNLIGKTSNIPVNNISIVPSLGSIGTSRKGIQFRNVKLSTGNQTIINSMQGDLKRSFNIAYRVTGGKSFLNQPAGEYKTTIVYSILPI